jgi:hypothetical protein
MPTAEPDLQRYARGFLLTERPTPAPGPDWTSTRIGDLHLATAPGVPVEVRRRGGHWVAVVGHFIDTERWSTTGEALQSAADALSHSETAFFELTDAWSGRYLLVYGTATSHTITTDATAMRSAFHTLEGPLFVASHASLIARLIDAPANTTFATFRKLTPFPGTKYGPGRATPWRNVVFLTANLALDIERRAIRRIFPRGPIGRTTARDAAAVIADKLRRQMSMLDASGRPLAVSVTSGLDSRLTLAASRDIRNRVQYFTYRNRGYGNEVDVIVGRKLAATFGLPHRVLHIDPGEPSASLLAALREATFLRHAFSLVTEFREAFAPDTIHLRSNLAEIGRCFYQKQGWTAAELSAKGMAEVWGRQGRNPMFVEAFADWAQAAQFDESADLDPLDAFYWEHRMPCWHSLLLLESDLAFDTHILFNARTVLTEFLRVPLEDRLRATVFRLVPDLLWPELARVPPVKLPRSRRLRYLRMKWERYWAVPD